jgi:hypothetical protein
LKFSLAIGDIFSEETMPKNQNVEEDDSKNILAKIQMDDRNKLKVSKMKESLSLLYRQAIG